MSPQARTRRTTSLRPSASLVVASLALVVAGTGTGYAALAAGSVGTPQLKTDAVTSVKIKNGAVTGADVAESSLGTVRRAADASRVGGTPLSGLLRATGCQTGKVRGFAQVLANGSIPTTFAQTGVAESHSCTRGAVEVRRTGAGRHVVRFAGNTAPSALVQVLFENDGADEASCATARRNPGEGVGAFSVTTFDCSTDAVVNADFTIVLP